jgi:hypothetical protein
MCYFKELSQHLPGGTEGNHENSQPEHAVSGLRFKTRISRTQGRTFDLSLKVNPQKSSQA